MCPNREAANFKEVYEARRKVEVYSRVRRERFVLEVVRDGGHLRTYKKFRTES